MSKLHLEGNELRELASDFNQILKFVNKISEIDNYDLKFDEHQNTAGEKQLKTIQTGSHLPMETIKRIAPKFEAGYFVVPRVIENNG